ncbi:MAG: hypothetical protein KGN36_02255 [Acidobacteriota bacterium]|nr:hypothetical protein [Acidobacteriota bacterium]
MLPLLALAAVSAVLDPSPAISGDCNPTRIHFTGRITSGAAAKITYTWVRLNHPAGPAQTVELDKPGSAPVSYDLFLRKSEDGAVMLRILLPSETESGKVRYRVTCK